MRLRKVYGKFSKPDRFYADDGPFGTDVEITAEEYERRLPPPVASEGPSSLVSWDALQSVALELHPSRVEEARAEMHKRGLVGVDIGNDGSVTFNSRTARRDYMKAFNFYDRDAGYGDHAGRSVRPAEPPLDWHPDLMQGNTRRYRSRQEEDAAIRAEAEQIAREILELEQRRR